MTLFGLWTALALHQLHILTTINSHQQSLPLYTLLVSMSALTDHDLTLEIALLPKGWVNKDRLSQPVDPAFSTPCASPGTSLLTFALVNLLTLLGAFVLGRATVRYHLSCGLLPKHDPEDASLPKPRSFLRMIVFIPALIMIVLELMSSCVGAYLAYSSGVLTLQSLVVMALARPRGTWVTVAACFVVGNVLKRFGIIKRKRMWMRNYQSSHFTMLATEVVLEVIGIIPTVYLLSTIVDSGRRRAIAAPDAYTRVLYIGAVIYVIGIAFSTSLLATAMVLWVWRCLEVDFSVAEGEELQAQRLDVVKRRRRWIIVSMFAFGWIPALGSWMIWTGFVHVAKDLWVTLLLGSEMG